MHVSAGHELLRNTFQIALVQFMLIDVQARSIRNFEICFDFIRLDKRNIFKIFELKTGLFK